MFHLWGGPSIHGDSTQIQGYSMCQWGLGIPFFEAYGEKEETDTCTDTHYCFMVGLSTYNRTYRPSAIKHGMLEIIDFDDSSI